MILFKIYQSGKYVGKFLLKFLLYVYESHSINKVNFALGVSCKKHSFSRKSIVIGPFMSQKTVCITFFTTPGIFLYQRVLVIHLSIYPTLPP